MYIYQYPFIVKEKSGWSNLTLDYFDENDREDEIGIRNLILSFCVQENLIVKVDNELRIDPGKDMGDFRWIMANTNFRSLVDKTQFNKVMSCLIQGDSIVLNKILDVHFRIGATFNIKLINSIVYRVMSAITVIPYSVAEDSEIATWEDIHRNVPFMWLLIYMQSIIRNEVTKVIGE